MIPIKTLNYFNNLINDPDIDLQYHYRCIPMLNDKFGKCNCVTRP